MRPVDDAAKGKGKQRLSHRTFSVLPFPRLSSDYLAATHKICTMTHLAQILVSTEVKGVKEKYIFWANKA